MKTLKQFWWDERGVDLVEYSLLLAFIVLTGAATYMTMTTQMGLIFSVVDNRISNANQTVSGS